FTTSSNFPTTVGAFKTFKSNNEDAFVTRLNSAGSSLVYSTYLGGNVNDEGMGIVVDSAGNAYVTGFTTSTDFPTVNPLQSNLGNSWWSDSDAFVSKLNSAGSILGYSTYLGGNLSDVGYGITIDSAGNAYVTGVTFSTNFPLANPLQISNGGSEDVFVTKLN